MSLNFCGFFSKYLTLISIQRNCGLATTCLSELWLSNNLSVRIAAEVHTIYTTSRQHCGLAFEVFSYCIDSPRKDCGPVSGGYSVSYRSLVLLIWCSEVKALYFTTSLSLVLLFNIYILRKGWSFLSKWIPFTQGCFMPCLVETGSVVVEKRTKNIKSLEHRRQWQNITVKHVYNDHAYNEMTLITK